MAVRRTIEEVSGDNPFAGHKYSSEEERLIERREPFSTEEKAIIRSYEWEKPVYKMLVDLGIYSGCRISELCNLKKKHVVVDEGIVAINIEKDKTMSYGYYSKGHVLRKLKEAVDKATKHYY